MSMPWKHVHLSDREIVSFLDGETPHQTAAKIDAKLALCVQCRDRLVVLNSMSREVKFLEAEKHRKVAVDLPVASSSMLRARLQRGNPRSSRLAGVTISVGRQLACAAIALVIVAGGTWTLHRFAMTDSPSGVIELAALPQRALTPGAVRAVKLEELCGADPVSNDPPVNASLKAAVFNEYGVRAASSSKYALDYLITPALGGTENIHNLWPQSSSARWNAAAKDKLEDHLHALVCQRQVSLEAAQQEIAVDWIAAYRKYFPAEEPAQAKRALTTNLIQWGVSPSLTSNSQFASLPYLHTRLIVSRDTDDGGRVS